MCSLSTTKRCTVADLISIRLQAAQVFRCDRLRTASSSARPPPRHQASRESKAFSSIIELLFVANFFRSINQSIHRQAEIPGPTITQLASKATHGLMYDVPEDLLYRVALHLVCYFSQVRSYGHSSCEWSRDGLLWRERDSFLRLLHYSRSFFLITN